MSHSESHRLAAVDLLEDAFRRAGIPLAKLRAVEFVDHVAAHAVEIVQDLRRAEEGKLKR